MARTDTAKRERMHIRLDALSKQKLERAAIYAHKSMSEFVLSQALLRPTRSLTSMRPSR